MNKKLLVSILVMSFLMIGTVSAVTGVKPASSGKETFELGYDCYHESPDLYWEKCKQVEHKVSWFEKKDFSRVIHCYRDGIDWICKFIAWVRFAKI